MKAKDILASVAMLAPDTEVMIALPIGGGKASLHPIDKVQIISQPPLVAIFALAPQPAAQPEQKPEQTKAEVPAPVTKMKGKNDVRKAPH